MIQEYGESILYCIFGIIMFSLFIYALFFCDPLKNSEEQEKGEHRVELWSMIFLGIFVAISGGIYYFIHNKIELK